MSFDSRNADGLMSSIGTCTNVMRQQPADNVLKPPHLIGEPLNHKTQATQHDFRMAPLRLSSVVTIDGINTVASLLVALAALVEGQLPAF
jgi:hypothetical protein